MNNFARDFAALATAAYVVGAIPTATTNRAEAKTYIAPAVASILAEVPKPGVSPRFAKGAMGFGNVFNAQAETQAPSAPTREASVTQLSGRTTAKFVKPLTLG